MARRKKKHDPITLKLRPAWKVAKGHPAPLAGAGEHKDKRTKRKRTRNDAARDVMKDQNDG